jgi:hypothetical protein
MAEVALVSLMTLSFYYQPYNYYLVLNSLELKPKMSKVLCQETQQPSKSLQAYKQPTATEPNNKLMSAHYTLLHNRSDSEYTDSISQYNQVILQYNDAINVKSATLLQPAYTDGIYRAWTNTLHKNLVLVLLAYLSPYITVVALCLTLYCLVIHENAMTVYRANNKTTPDIFENMVYNDQLCNSSHYVYFHIRVSELPAFRFSSFVVQELLKRVHNETISFMVYDRVFRNYFEGLHSPRSMLWISLFLNLTFFVMMQLLVYGPLLCFNLLHPVDSIAQCSTEVIDLALL